MTENLKEIRDHQVVVKNSKIHGRGVFAKKPFDKNELIGLYEGAETNEDGTYVLWVEDADNGRPYGIEGRNELRYTNHSGQPNAVFYGNELWSLRPIAAGDEITFHYGPDWE